ncbi:O-antigen ligase family protein [Vagococcus lutrae]|uniref:O-antigen ligase family protein n=1 Tax=Vagococcus lutrae TaxID=81947 RepID=UPI0028916471|nr:O-antigen ligase family protein [Vagococcus lutrae]MDT2823845.1 O-antigen ligase family protein [Vagococcus lutrae]
MIEQKRNTYNIYMLIFLFFSIVLAYGAEYRGKIYNLLIVGGIYLIVNELLDIIKYQRINKNQLKTVFYTSTPFILNALLLLNQNLINKERHINVLILTLFSTFSSVFLCKRLLTNTNKAKITYLKMSYIWSCVNVTLFLLYKVGLYKSGNGSFSGFYINRNDFAISSVILLFLISFIDFDKKDHLIYKKIIVTKLALTALIISTLSIKGFVGVLIIVIYTYFLNKNKSINKKILLIIMLLILSPLTLLINFDLFNRFNLYLETLLGVTATYENANYRLTLIKQGIEIIKDNFWLGIGIDNSRYYLFVENARGNEIGKYSHNNLIEIFLNGGIFTFIAYYIPIVFIMFSSLKKYKYNKNYLFVITGLTLKIFFDLSSVTYNNASVIFLTVISIFCFFECNRITKK